MEIKKGIDGRSGIAFDDADSSVSSAQREGI